MATVIGANLTESEKEKLQELFRVCLTTRHCYYVKQLSKEQLLINVCLVAKNFYDAVGDDYEMIENVFKMNSSEQVDFVNKLLAKNPYAVFPALRQYRDFRVYGFTSQFVRVEIMRENYFEVKISDAGCEIHQNETGINHVFEKPFDAFIIFHLFLENIFFIYFVFHYKLIY